MPFSHVHRYLFIMFKQSEVSWVHIKFKCKAKGRNVCTKNVVYDLKV